MTEKINSPKFKFLPDIASDIDAFDGGHSKTADAIFDFIESNDFNITIGLEGKWGSGKSTIIELLKAKLKNSKTNYLVFTFDAWAHEGDPLRRTFLCSLLDFLNNNHCFDDYNNNNQDKDYCKTKKDSLNGTRSKTTTSTKPKVTATGVSAALSTLFLIPLSLSLFNWALDIGIIFFKSCVPNLPFIFSIIVGLLPFPIVLFVHKLEFGKEDKNKKKRDSLEEDEEDNDSPIQVETGNDETNEESKEDTSQSKLVNHLKKVFSNFLTKEGETVSTTNTYTTPNPTSVEFESVFRDILQKAKHPNLPSMKLVFILDNLDRIQSEDTKAILSTFQTFLQYQQRNEDEKKFPNIWTIIPYDPEGMRKIWEEKDSNNGEVIRSGNYARRMLEKRFQIRFYTPPIIYTGWKRFMLDKLDEAFPSPTKFDDRRNEVFNSIYNIYNLFLEWWSTEKGDSKNGELNGDEVLPISPRDLIIFINQLGSLYKQWGSQEAKVRFENMAIFVLLRTRNPKINIPEFLRSNQDQEKLPKNICNLYLKKEFDWKGDFAVLWFNVERRRAKVLLIQDEIVEALTQPDVEKLNLLNEENVGVLDSIQYMLNFGLLYNKIHNREEYLHAIHALYKSSMRGEIKNKKWIITPLLENFSGQYTATFNMTYATYLLNSFNFYKECELNYSLFEIIKSEYHALIFTSQTSNKIIKAEDVDKWIYGLNYLHQNHTSQEFQQLQIMSGEFPFFDEDKESTKHQKRIASLIYCLGILDKIDEDLHPIITNEGLEEVLDDEISTLVKSFVFKPSESNMLRAYPVFGLPSDVLNSIKGARKIYNNVSYPKTIDAAITLLRDSRLQIEEFPTKEHVIHVFFLLNEIIGTGETSKLFNQQPGDNNMLLAYFGYILAKCNESQESTDYQHLGLLLWINLLVNNNLTITDAGFATQARDFILNQLFVETLSYPKILNNFCETYLNCQSEKKSTVLIGIPEIKPAGFGFVCLCTLLILEKLTEDERVFLQNFLVNQWKKFITYTGVELRETIIKKLICNKFLVNFFESVGTIKNDSSFNFLTMLVQSPDFKNSHKLKLLALLEKIEIINWEEILLLEDVLIFLNNVKEKFKRLILTEKYSVALKNIATNLLTNSINLKDEFTKYWDTIIELIPNRETFNKDIFSAFTRNHLTISNPSFLNFFGSCLFSQVNLENNSDTIISELIKPQLLSHPEESSKHVLNLFENCGKRTLRQIITDESDLNMLRQELENKINTSPPSQTTVIIFHQIISFLPQNEN